MPSSSRTTAVDGVPCVRKRLTKIGFSDEVTNMILNSRRASTQKQYDPHIKAWESFCISQNKDAVFTTVPIILQFLISLYHKGLSYSTINTARSAIASCVELPNGAQLGNDRDVHSFMKGIFNVKPPRQQKVATWDPEIVLTFLKNNRLNACDLLTVGRRLATLILLVSGQRPQILVALRLQCMTLTTTVATFSVSSNDVKQGRPGYRPPDVKLVQFEDENLCVFRHLKMYLELTKPFRSDIDQLFITTRKPYKPVTLNTLSRWVKSVLMASGIDASLASAGSARGATTTKALDGGAPLEVILGSAGWSNLSTFTKFYRKPLLTDATMGKYVLKQFCSK